MDNEKILEFLTTPEGITLIQPHIDKSIADGIEKWKQKDLPRLIKQHEEAKLNSPESKITMLQQQLQLRQRSTELRRLISEKGLDAFINPEDITELLITVDDEQAIKTIDMLTAHVKHLTDKITNAQVEERLSHMNTSPQMPEQSNVPWMSKQQLIEMDYYERVKIYQQNPDEFKRIMNS